MRRRCSADTPNTSQCTRRGDRQPMVCKCSKGCINDEDPIDLDEFEEGDMVFQTTDGICYKDTYTRETLRNEMAYRQMQESVGKS